MHIIYILIITIVMKILPTWIYAAPGCHRRSSSCPGARRYESTASLFVPEAVELGNALGIATTRWRCSLAAPFLPMTITLARDGTIRYHSDSSLLWHRMVRLILRFSPGSATISDSYQYVFSRSTSYIQVLATPYLNTPLDRSIVGTYMYWVGLGG
jgi:hypothetical protein